MEELYLGAVDVPADIDAFWDARVAEADAIPLEWELTPADIPYSEACEFWDLRFKGAQGELLYAKYLRPRTNKDVPLVLQFHGYPGATRSWYEQLSFVGMGCAILAMDNPGQGGKSQDKGGFAGTTVAGHLVAGLDGPLEDMYYVRLYKNIRVLCRVVQELKGINHKRIFVNGASQGAAAGLACAGLNPEYIHSAALLYPFLSDFKRVFELGADEIAYEGLRYYARWFDPDGERASEWFGKLAYYDSVSFAHRVECPVLFGTGLADDVCPPITQDAVYNRMNCERERHFFEGKGHEEIEAFDDLIPGFFGEDACVCSVLELCADDDKRYTARLVRPKEEGRYPLVLLFHDCIREPRGWLHLRRYAGAGFAVLELENASDVSSEAFECMAQAALAAFDKASSLSCVDSSRILSFGEGTGAALALYVAAKRETKAAAAINPYPIEPLLNEAASICCPVLFGTCRMDEIASPEAQDELASRIRTLIRKNYPKYIHERVNAFENEFLRFSIEQLR